MLKWKLKHTHIKVVGEEEKKDKSLLIAIPIAIIAIALIITIIPSVILSTNNGENIFENMFSNINFEFGSSMRNSKDGKNTLTDNAAVSKVHTSSKNNTSSSKKNNATSSSKNTTTNNGSTSITKKNKYPTLKEIEGDYGINITEKYFINGVADNSRTQEASGIETLTCSGGKIKYLSYTMNYNETTGYANYTSSKYSIEGYFTYKNGKVRAELKVYRYENNDRTIKIEKTIKGNKI